MRPLRIRLNLGLKLILIFLVIGLVPVVATSVTNIVLTSDVLRERIINDEQASLQQKVSEIERFLETTVNDIHLLSRSYAVQQMAQVISENDTLALQPAREATASEFISFVESRRTGEQRIYARIRFLDATGFEFVRVDDVEGRVESVMNLNYRNSETYFVEAKNLAEGEIYVSPINLFDEYGRIQRPYNPVLQYSTPIYVDDQLIGVIVTDVQAQDFLDLVQANLPSEATAFLVDQDGYYLSHPDPDRLFGRDLETGIQLQTDFPELGSTLDSTSADTLELADNIIFYQSIEPPGQNDIHWLLYSLRSLDSVLEPARQQQNTLLLALGLFAVLVTGAALFFARSLSRPIAQLTHISTSIAGGDLKQRVYIDRQDELGELARTFNSMTDQLQDSIEHLEERVNARTRDLQIAADVSRQITMELDIDELLQHVVLLTTQSFKLYAAFIFRYDHETKHLTRAAGVTDGEQMQVLSEFDTIALDAVPSVIALAARTARVVRVNDTAQSTDYLEVPTLLATRSEIAIPLLLGDRLLGVFDLQSKQTDRFSETDERVLTSLAEQITIAMRNAQLFTETQQAREAAEQANLVKSQFLANMSHELRTPLNAILNFTGFVADGVLGPVTDQQKDSLNKVVYSGQHLLSLINDILDLTKIEVGMMELFVQDVNLNEALDGVLSTAKGLVKDKPVEIIKDFEANLPIIMGDRRRVRQILLNLVSNAVKFTPSGSVTISAYHEDADIKLIVKDTGIGIPPEQYGVVFETFRQAKHELVDSPGTGLGMPITKAFVEAHGGRIWFESEVGVGTTFFVTLPVASPDAADTQSAQTPEAAG